ncbi:MAG: hypothetical protein ACYC9J_13675 [Sulfuricaulis sp.]
MTPEILYRLPRPAASTSRFYRWAYLLQHKSPHQPVYDSRGASFEVETQAPARLKRKQYQPGMKGWIKPPCRQTDGFAVRAEAFPINNQGVDTVNTKLARDFR